MFKFSHKQLQENGSAPIPFRRRWDNEGDWEIFGHITAVPIRRPQNNCCDELKKEIAALEAKEAALEKRRKRIEADLAAQAKGFASDLVRRKALSKPARLR